MDSKPFASLSANLLARKGAARPAMRRPYLGPSQGATLPAAAQDDLGWNDMGEEAQRDARTEGGAPVPPLTMADGKSVGQPPQPFAPPPVVRQREDLAEKMNRAAAIESSPAAAPADKQKSRKGNRASISMRRKGKAAFTLRLDPERHLRLRLACTLANRSAQQIVTQALDAFLDNQPQIEELARRVPRPGGSAAKAK